MGNGKSEKERKGEKKDRGKKGDLAQNQMRHCSTPLAGTCLVISMAISCVVASRYVR